MITSGTLFPATTSEDHHDDDADDEAAGFDVYVVEKQLANWVQRNILSSDKGQKFVEEWSTYHSGLLIRELGGRGRNISLEYSTAQGANDFVLTLTPTIEGGSAARALARDLGLCRARADGPRPRLTWVNNASLHVDLHGPREMALQGCVHLWESACDCSRDSNF